MTVLADRVTGFLVVIQPSFNIMIFVYLLADLHPLHADNGGAPDEENPGR